MLSLTKQGTSARLGKPETFSGSRGSSLEDYTTTRRTKSNCIFNCGNVCHLQCQNCTDHKHQIKDW